MLIGAEPHDVLHTGPVVVAPVEDDDLAGRREMRHVALQVHLGFLPVRGRRQGRNAEDARAWLTRSVIALIAPPLPAASRRAR